MGLAATVAEPSEGLGLPVGGALVVGEPEAVEVRLGLGVPLMHTVTEGVAQVVGVGEGAAAPDAVARAVALGSSDAVPADEAVDAPLPLLLALAQPVPDALPTPDAEAAATVAVAQPVVLRALLPLRLAEGQADSVMVPLLEVVPASDAGTVKAGVSVMVHPPASRA